MKKTIFTFLLLITFLFLAPVKVQAQVAAVCDESNEGADGLVPCGNKTQQTCIEGRSLAGYSIGDTISCSSGNCTPSAGYPSGLLQCRQVTQLVCRCELYHVFRLLLNVYKFVVLKIAAPLTGLLVMIGGVLIIAGSGYPKLHDLGKRIVWGAIWGLLLILSSWLIINLVMIAIGYPGQWFIF